MSTIGLRKAVAAGALCALLLVAPAPAAARVTVTIEFVYGGVLGCGLGFFVYFARAWEIPFAARSLQSALLEIGDGRARVGVPVPTLNLGGYRDGEQGPQDGVQVDLLRWRF